MGDMVLSVDPMNLMAEHRSPGMYEEPRETANRFVGGAENRLENLTQLLEYVAAEQPVERERLFEWIVDHTDIQTEGTFDKHLRFIVGLGLLDKSGGPINQPGEFRLGPYGVKAVATLEDPKGNIAHVIFEALANRVRGFDHLLQELQMQPIDVADRAAVLAAGYDDREFRDDVAEKHYVWLEAIGYIQQTNGQYILIDLGGEAVEMPRQELRSLGEREPSTLLAWNDSTTTTSSNVSGEQEIAYVANVGELVERSRAHEEALGVLVEHLTAEGFTCNYTEHSDLLAVRGETIILVEAKTITPASALSQIRSAVGQLFEYEFYDVEKRTEWESHDVVRCLYLASPPGQDLEQYLGYLPSRGIEVLWENDGDIEGPSWPDLGTA